jgi:hypothetical protein
MADFRGYLNGLAQGGDGAAQLALNYAGNDGRLDPRGQQALGTTDYLTLTNWVNGQYNAYNTPKAAPATASGGGGGAAGANGTANANFVNQAYNTKIAGLQGIFDSLQPQQDTANLDVQNQYQNQSNALNTQKAQGTRNLDLATQQVGQGRARSLADLSRQIQTQGRSYANQLGAYGAGDSSATGLINQALSGMASRNRSDVLYNSGNQQRGIDLQRQDLDTEYNNNVKTLDDWKNQSLHDIASKFLQQRQQIQQQIGGANADRAQSLAQLNAAYTNQAIQQLASLENQYRQGASDLVNQYRNLSAPNVGIASNLQQFAVKPISAGQIGQMRSVPAVSAGNQPTPYAQRKPFQEDYGFGL